MLRPRITPCLLLRDGGLVKTVRFADEKYVGDPVNAVKIFNEKEADELVVLDISATAAGSAPNMRLIAQFAVECRMPLCYGGGIKTVQQAREIISLGVEKIAISSAAVERPALIADIADAVGRQSVVVVLDAARVAPGQYEVRTHNGARRTGRQLVDLVHEAESQGAGEIVVNAIDRDGVMDGYDLEMARIVRAATRLPMSVVGGAGSLAHIGELLRACGVIGAVAGSLFVFKGARRAVLITYPDRLQKDHLIREALLP
jgi:imidazole glycerol-phosphate synthase subunit HisF